MKVTKAPIHTAWLTRNGNYKVVTTEWFNERVFTRKSKYGFKTGEAANKYIDKLITT